MFKYNLLFSGVLSLLKSFYVCCIHEPICGTYAEINLSTLYTLSINLFHQITIITLHTVYRLHA